MTARRSPSQLASDRAGRILDDLLDTVEGLRSALALGHAGLVRQYALRLDLDAISAYKSAMRAAEEHEAAELAHAQAQAEEVTTRGA